MKLWPISIIERFSRFLLSIPNAVLCVAGGLALALSLIAGAIIERKEVAVAVAVAGTFVGTALLSFFLPKFLYAIKAEELEQLAKDALKNEKLADEVKRARDVERRLADAEREIARLENMRINIEAFRSVLKLGLLEVPMKITDFKEDIIERIERPKLDPRKNYNRVYVGVFELPILATLGIDLAKVRVRKNEDGHLIVSNITPTHSIDTLDIAKWKLDEVRNEYLDKDGNVVEIECNPADPQRLKDSRAHETQVRARLREGDDFKDFKPGVIKAAKQVIESFLQPAGSKVVFTEGPNDGGTDIFTFLKAHNEGIDGTIVDLEDQSKAIQQPK